MNYRMKTRLATVGLAVLLMSASAKATTSTAHDVILSFDGKAGAVGWDLGVLRSLNDKIDYNSIDKLFLVGSSSGSIGSTYFACHGFSPASVANMEAFPWDFDLGQLGEAKSQKALELLLDLPNPRSVKILDRIVDFVTDNRSCLPTAPYLLVAANHDVLFAKGPSTMAPGQSKTLDESNFDVRTRATGRLLGKACTYFANHAAADILRQVPPTERLCDIRVLETADDVVFAIHATVSEPTYFLPLQETHPERITDSVSEPRQRVYAGGFILMAPVQDVKRVWTEATVIGTGRALLSRIENRVIKNWYLVDMNRTLMQAGWWHDWRAEPTFSEWQAVEKGAGTIAEAAMIAEKGIKRCEATSTCKSALVLKPGFTTGVDGTDLTSKVGRGLKILMKQ